jgi:hypothetical protein
VALQLKQTASKDNMINLKVQPENIHVYALHFKYCSAWTQPKLFDMGIGYFRQDCMGVGLATMSATLLCIFYGCQKMFGQPYPQPQLQPQHKMKFSKQA